MKKALMTLIYIAFVSMLYATEKPQNPVEQQTSTVQPAAGVTVSSSATPLTINVFKNPFKGTQPLNGKPSDDIWTGFFLLAVGVVLAIIPIVQIVSLVFFLGAIFFGILAWRRKEDMKAFNRVATKTLLFCSSVSFAAMVALLIFAVALFT